WIASARRECTDRILITGRRHLHHTLIEYVDHYNTHRPHRTLSQKPPGGRTQPAPPPQPPAAPARARPPRRQHLPAADQAPARPRRPPQRIRASRVEAQVKTCGRVLESHNLGTARIHRKPILNGLINEYAHAA